MKGILQVAFFIWENMHDTEEALINIAPPDHRENDAKGSL